MSQDNKSKKKIIAIGALLVPVAIAFIFYGGISRLLNYARAQSGNNPPAEVQPPVADAASEPVTPTNQSTTEPVVKTDPNEKGVYRLDSGEVVYMNEKKIELEATISNYNMPLELLACSAGGKDYESLVVLKCKPRNIQTALMMFGLKEGEKPKKQGEIMKPTGDPVVVIVEWENKGKKFSYRAEDLIIDIRTEKPWPRVGWVYTGSTFEDEIDYDTGKPTGRQIYLAEATKTIIATYHDPAAIIDNPTESGGYGTGTFYQPNKPLLPEIGTAVKVIIRVPTEKEIEEIKKAKEDVTKWEADWKKKVEEEMKKWEEEKRKKEQEQNKDKPDPNK
ncbi:MAG: hypothetical protein HY811_10950 [Planctomycetes bacterium]|nr:hypothetical protein [Planctomycetota bacterium]